MLLELLLLKLLLLFKLDELDSPPEKNPKITSNYSLNISLQYITLLFKSYSFLYIIYLGVKKSFDTLLDSRVYIFYYPPIMYGSTSVPLPPLTKAVEFKETTERTPNLLLEP